MYKSNATWSKIPRTDDSHRTKDQALAVCKILLEDYGSEPGCPLRGVCTAAWVEKDEKFDTACKNATAHIKSLEAPKKTRFFRENAGFISR